MDFCVELPNSSCYGRVSDWADRCENRRVASDGAAAEARGRLTIRRCLAGQLHSDESDVLAVLKPGFDASNRSTVVYCRVSSPGQSDDLASRVAAMVSSCLAAGIAVDRWVCEAGGGMDLRRGKFVALMERVEEGQISNSSSRTRIVSPGLGSTFIERVAARYFCEMVVVGVESLSPRRELVGDMQPIVPTVSWWLYRLRRYEMVLQDELGGGR